MAKGQVRSNREKKKPKADREKKEAASVASPFACGLSGRGAAEEILVACLTSGGSVFRPLS
jgi:hypothetical protein